MKAPFDNVIVDFEDDDTQRPFAVRALGEVRDYARLDRDSLIRLRNDIDRALRDFAERHGEGPYCKREMK